MTKQEFKELTQLEPTDALFNKIEDAYYAVGDMDKYLFCDNWVIVGDNIITSALLKRIKILEGMLEERTNEVESFSEDKSDLADFLIGKACSYDDTDLYKKAVQLIGQKEVVRRKCKDGLPLWEEDIEYITPNLK